MKSITRTLIVLVIAITGLASCSKDEPDGLWPKMKWNAPQNLVEENGIYIVPAEGGEYTFECTNYSGVWLSLIEDNGEIPEEELTEDEKRIKRMAIHGQGVRREL